MCETKGEMSNAVASFYKDVVDNIRFAKQQQWRVTNYTLLVYAAVFVLKLRAQHCFEIASLTVLTILAVILGIVYINVYRNWLRKSRKRLNAIYKTYFSEKERDNLYIDPNRALTGNDPGIDITLVVIILVGAVVVLYFLWAHPITTD